MERYAEVMASVAMKGFSNWLGIEALPPGDADVAFRVDVREDMTQHRGYVHGGVLSALADNACAWAGALACGRDVVTSNVTVHFLRPAQAPALRVVGKVVRAGRNTITTEAEVWALNDGAPDKICVRALAAITVLRHD